MIKSSGSGRWIPSALVVPRSYTLVERVGGELVWLAEDIERTIEAENTDHAHFIGSNGDLVAVIGR